MRVLKIIVKGRKKNKNKNQKIAIAIASNQSEIKH
jgi:hypothetical protein